MPGEWEDGKQHGKGPLLSCFLVCYLTPTNFDHSFKIYRAGHSILWSTLIILHGWLFTTDLENRNATKSLVILNSPKWARNWWKPLFQPGIAQHFSDNQTTCTFLLDQLSPYTSWRLSSFFLVIFWLPPLVSRYIDSEGQNHQGWMVQGTSCEIAAGCNCGFFVSLPRNHLWELSHPTRQWRWLGGPWNSLRRFVASCML